MTKQQFILKMLDILWEDRPLSKGLRMLIENNAFSEKVIDGLLQVFQSGTTAAMTDSQLQKLRNSVAILQKIKASDAKEGTIASQELADLDAELAKL